MKSIHALAITCAVRGDFEQAIKWDEIALADKNFELQYGTDARKWLEYSKARLTRNERD